MPEISNFWTAGPILKNKSSFERARWAEFNGLFYYNMRLAVQKLFQKYWIKKSTICTFFKCLNFFRLWGINLISTNIFPESLDNLLAISAVIGEVVMPGNLICWVGHSVWVIFEWKTVGKGSSKRCKRLMWAPKWL